MRNTRRITRMKCLNGSRLALGAVVALIALTAAECRAETAYVAQIPANVRTSMPFSGAMPQQPPQQYHHSSNYASAGVARLPEAPVATHGNNLAQTLEIGMRNSVYHLQSGANNTSTAGIIGNYGNINVLQAGNNLKSNVVLLNGAGLSVSVLQPAGSAPVNVLIARFPGGGLLIKR